MKFFRRIFLYKLWLFFSQIMQFGTEDRFFLQTSYWFLSVCSLEQHSLNEALC